MAVGAREAGKILALSAGELLRIWRLARASARREIFPGLLDGVMGDFLVRAGRLLEEGKPPEEVWRGVVGMVRWPPDSAAREITSEWAIAMEVLGAACESFGAEPEVGGWLARAVAEAEKGTPAVGGGPGDPPAGVLRVLVLGGQRPPPAPARSVEETQ